MCAQDPSHRGAYALLSGHNDVVNVVKHFPISKKCCSILLSGAADKTIRIWCNNDRSDSYFREVRSIEGHAGAINTIAVYPKENLFISGSADATVKVWKLNHSHPDGRSSTNEKHAQFGVELLQTIEIWPRFLPLAVAVSDIPGSDSLILGISGTSSAIQIYLSTGAHFEPSAVLTGHEGWIRSLAFVHETADDNADVLLASSSQDKFSRLWRLHQGEELPKATTAANDPVLGVLGRSLSNKAHRLETNACKYSLTFEALLLGHEDWIYSACWRPQGEKLRLMTASADNSLAMWEPDPSSGVWICSTRLGEINAQKGATTATGSTGGFWTSLWSPQGNAVVSLGRTGSWRLWKFGEKECEWKPDVSISGHIKGVQDLAWSRDGSYLLSTSSDQTTRLFAEWTNHAFHSWHEFSRPQIHGYDLNCIDTIGNTQFISGADEKLLRVFNEPGAVANLLSRACGLEPSVNGFSLDAANIPVLGLSNKAIESVDDEEPSNPLLNGGSEDREAVDPASVVHKSTLDFGHAPLEDHLSRHLLWPETEKLYGHGYEISALAASHDGCVVATACKASSSDQAVIRLYETNDWREIKPALTAHSLTVTSLAFSPDDRFLLSTGRDRKWTIFERSPEQMLEYQLVADDPKGHSRMILAGCWAPKEFQYVFSTAGRDKSVKIWCFDALTEPKTICKAIISATAPVTAVDFSPGALNQENGLTTLAYGTEEGNITVLQITKDVQVCSTSQIARELSPSKTVTRLQWRPKTLGQYREDAISLLGAASEDCSIRLYWFKNV